MITGMPLSTNFSFNPLKYSSCSAYRLAYDSKLLSDVLAVFLRVVRGWYCRQAKAAGYKDVHTGSVTFCQRFGKDCT